MKYLPLQALDDVASALNFETADLRIVGGCDIYTTKAAGGDKKLYRSIEHSLESQYESALRISASLSPPQATQAAAALNLSRSSPFGPLSQISSRRTFAYMIATLNATNPDHDFSHNARPSDFRREKNLRLVMNTIDTTLLNMRPKPASSSLGAGGSGPGYGVGSGMAGVGTGGNSMKHSSMEGAHGRGGGNGLALRGSSSQWSLAPADTAVAPPSGPAWQPAKMWRLIDKEMSLRECGVYCYAPDDEPWTDGDGADDEAALWSFNYFFFNKARKRVCYFFLRAYSVFGADISVPRTPMSARSVAAGTEADDDDEDDDDYDGNNVSYGKSHINDEPTSRKRAAFWLGVEAAAVLGGEEQPDPMDGVETALAADTSAKDPRLLGPADSPPHTVHSGSELESPVSDISVASQRPLRQTRARTQRNREWEGSADMVAGPIEI